MAWETSDRRSELPPDWAKIRLERMRYDKWRCTWILPGSRTRCPRPAEEVDHVGDRHDHGLKNLRSLCSHHHKQRTQKQASTARWKRKGSKRRPSEAHPGLVL